MTIEESRALTIAINSLQYNPDLDNIKTQSYEIVLANMRNKAQEIAHEKRIYAKTRMQAMPGSCNKCEFGERYGCVGDVKCRILREYFTGNIEPPYKDRPNECPLVDLMTPPNDPLTLEELREMDGQPVWWWNTSAKPVCTICVRDRFMTEPMFANYDFMSEDTVKLTKYKWLKKCGYKPYRRKPENGG